MSTWLLASALLIILSFETIICNEKHFNLEIFMNENKNYNIKLFMNNQIYTIIFDNVLDEPSFVIEQAINRYELLVSSNYWKYLDKVVFVIATLQNQFVKKYEILMTISIYLSLCNNYILSNLSMDNLVVTDIYTTPEVIINQQICRNLQNYTNQVLVNIADYSEIFDIINYKSYVGTMVKQGKNLLKSISDSKFENNDYLERMNDITSFEQNIIIDDLNTSLLIAIVTIVRDEAVFLPIWLRYYSSQVEAQHIYIIDNDSTDGSTSDIPYHVIKAPSEYYCSHEWILDTVQTVVAKLLSIGYGYVLFAEVDEFLIPSPTLYPGGLQEYIKNMKQSTVRATGYNLFHDYINNPKSIDLSKPILSQRNVWYADDKYSKNAITSIPLDWSVGFHSVELPQEHHNMIPDPNLYLLHLKKFDYQYFITRGHWKAIQDYNIYEYYHYAYSIGAHTVGDVLRYLYWQSIQTESTYQYLSNIILKRSDNSRILDAQIQMYQNLHNIPNNFIYPYPLL